MNYLIEKTSLTIEPSLAKRVGLNESIFLRQLHYWINKTKHKKDGRKWVFNTTEKWHEQLPFLSIRTIERVIAKLQKDELIEVKQYDKNLLNRTNWYTINYEKIEEIAKELNLETLPVKSDEKEKKNTKNSPNEGAEYYSEEFKQFWKFYPKKFGGKRLACAEFNKLNKKCQKQAIFGAEKYALQTANIEEKYIKTAKAWLKDGYYEEYEIKDTTQTTPVQVDMAEILSTKINILIDSKIKHHSSWDYMHKNQLLFTPEEKTILTDLGNNLEDYKEMEFQKGEIKSYLQGVL